MILFSCRVFHMFICWIIITYDSMWNMKNGKRGLWKKKRMEMFRSIKLSAAFSDSLFLLLLLGFLKHDLIQFYNLPIFSSRVGVGQSRMSLNRKSDSSRQVQASSSNRWGQNEQRWGGIKLTWDGVTFHNYIQDHLRPLRGFLVLECSIK